MTTIKFIILTQLAKLFGNLESITGVSFVNVTYTNKQGEVQNTTFNVGVSYENAQKKDIEYLKNLDVKTIKSSQSNQLLEEARKALIGSLISPSKAHSEGQKNAYTFLTNGLKMHNESKQLYVVGMKVKKTVIKEGEKKADTRGGLTKAKDDIKKGMKSSQYRQYNVSNMAEVSLKGDTLHFS